MHHLLSRQQENNARIISYNYVFTPQRREGSNIDQIWGQKKEIDRALKVGRLVWQGSQMHRARHTEI